MNHESEPRNHWLIRMQQHYIFLILPIFKGQNVIIGSIKTFLLFFTGSAEDCSNEKEFVNV